MERTTSSSSIKTAINSVKHTAPSFRRSRVKIVPAFVRPLPPLVHRHPASLVDKDLHDPALLSLIRKPVTRSMISYIASVATGVIKIQEDPHDLLLSPPSTPTHSEDEEDLSAKMASKTALDLEPLENFIMRIVEMSHVQVPTLLCTIVYLERLRAKLPQMAKGLHCTRHRVFLACLIVAAKFLNDSSPKNKHWCAHARIFDEVEVNLMERQLLFLLDFDLNIHEPELLKTFAPFLPGSLAVPAIVSPCPSSETTNSASATSSTRTVNVVHTNPAVAQATPQRNSMFKYRDQNQGMLLTPSPSPVRRTSLVLGGTMVQISPASSASEDLLTPDTCTTDEEGEPQHKPVLATDQNQKPELNLPQVTAGLSLSSPPTPQPQQTHGQGVIPLIKLSSSTQKVQRSNFLSNLGSTLTAGFRRDSSSTASAPPPRNGH